MRAKEYIEAAYRTIQNGVSVDTVLKNLKTSLSSRGLLALHPRIIRGLSERLLRSSATSIATVTLARSGDASYHKAEIETALNELTGSTAHNEQVDETIVGGFIVSAGGNRIDRSYKSALLHVYHKVVD